VSERTANQEKDDLNRTVDALRADLRTRDEGSSASIFTDLCLIDLYFH